MEVKDLYIFVREHYQYKAKMISFDSKKNVVTCLLYDSFVFQCTIKPDRYSDHFGGWIVVSSEFTIRHFLGEGLSWGTDAKSIRKSLDIVDNYCRKRLPDKFLTEYYDSYFYWME